MYNEGIIAVRAKLKGGKMRYVPMRPELGSSCDGIPPCSARIVFSRRKRDATCGQRVEGSFRDLLERAHIEDFRFMICATRLRPGT